MTIRQIATAFCALLGLLAIPARAATVATVASPSQVLTVTVALDNDGRASYAVSRRGMAVIAPSRLGFLFADAPKFERNLVAGAAATRSADATWEQPWGERRFVRDRFTELRLPLTEKGPPGAGFAPRRIDVVFRVYDEGFGFRYKFTGTGPVAIADELTEFNFASPGTAWWIPAGEWNRYEYLYNRTEPQRDRPRPYAGDDPHRQPGCTSRCTKRRWSITRRCGSSMSRASNFKAVLSPSWEAAKVRRTGPFTTPWRAMSIADSAGGLVESNLFLNLNEPNTLGDVSWVKPFKYVGVWWEMHLETASWASGAKHGATTANVRRYIDFAAANGFRGVLVEGWNKGWDGDWFGNGESFSFTESYPDFDLPGLAAYGKSKGVHLIGHHETSGNAAHYEEQLGDALDLYAKYGVDAVKTGYVADAGQAKFRGDDGLIHYGWHDGQAAARHHLKVVTEAAKRHIMVNAHEPIKDTGLRRTYPNWVAREGARGMEYNAWGDPPNPPEHEANLVFTRMLGGSDGLHARRHQPAGPRPEAAIDGGQAACRLCRAL